jgi:hypothetical protein
MRRLSFKKHTIRMLKCWMLNAEANPALPSALSAQHSAFPGLLCPESNRPAAALADRSAPKPVPGVNIGAALTVARALDAGRRP